MGVVDLLFQLPLVEVAEVPVFAGGLDWDSIVGEEAYDDGVVGGDDVGNFGAVGGAEVLDDERGGDEVGHGVSDCDDDYDDVNNLKGDDEGEEVDRVANVLGDENGDGEGGVSDDVSCGDGGSDGVRHRDDHVHGHHHHDADDDVHLLVHFAAVVVEREVGDQADGSYDALEQAGIVWAFRSDLLPASQVGIQLEQGRWSLQASE